MSEPLPEQIGKYPIIRQLGRGATSVVYLARDPFADREVAIKVIRNQPAQDTDLGRRYRRVFLNEAALVGKLFHPHILAIYDAFSDENVSYIVMEYVNGRTLEQDCEVADLLPISKVVEIVFKCSLALAFAQRHGVIHCDIKPANILIRGDTDIKISDFGAAQYEEAQHTHLKGIGSPAYMSPEQIRGSEEIDFRSDMFSLGGVMYHMLTGARPFGGSTAYELMDEILSKAPPPPSAVNSGISPALDGIVLRALGKSRNDRFESWNDFAAALEPPPA
jgi:serine/threonine protein kinase